MTETVEFRLGGAVVDRQPVTVDANSQETVTFEADTTGVPPGEYTHGVLTEADGQFATLTVSESFVVENLSAPPNATSGDEITVEADVSNPNDVNATQSATYRFAGGAIVSQEVTLEAGASATVTLNVTLNGLAEGTYNHGLLTRDAGQLAPIEVAAANVTDENTTVSISDQTSDGTSVVVDSVTVPRGGIIAIHGPSLLDGNVIGSVVGASEPLAPGTHENVTVELLTFPGSNDVELDDGEMSLIAMPHFDSNGNNLYDFVRTGGMADGPYVLNGSAVVDDANVTIEEDGEGPPEDVPPEEPGEDEEEMEDEEMEDEETEEETTEGTEETETPASIALALAAVF